MTSPTMPPRLRIVDTPLGPMRLQAEGGALTGAWFLDQDDCPPMPPGAGHPPAAGSGSGAGVAPDTRPTPGGLRAEDRPSVADTVTHGISAGPGLTAGARFKAKERAATLAAVAASDGAPVADPVLDRATLELAEYFAGRRREFSLPMAPRGTPFQRRVWDALRDISFGGLESYGALSARCAQAAAVRAVAQAVGRNPISIFIPCHRIIGSNSALTGFGGGLPRKQALLALEGHTYATALPGARRVEENPGQGNLW